MTFNPATGSNVNNGVVTITLRYNIANRKWFHIANDALSILNSMSGVDSANYGVFVMPNSVDFDGGIAHGYMPGIFTFFKSMAASAPVIQVHELGKCNFLSGIPDTIENSKNFF